MSQATFEQLCSHVKETALLASVESLLNWDERTIMPEKAGAYRAEQVTLLSRVIHERRTSDEIGEWLEELAGSELADDHHSDSGATIRLLKRQYDKKRKIPTELVEALTKASVLGQQAWVKAREADDFQAFAGMLTEVVNLKQQQADAVGYDECRYDALLDDFEPDEKTGNVTKVLGDLREDLVPFLAEIMDGPKKPNAEILSRSCPVETQESFGKMAAAAIGFDFDRGRLDVTHHPFCSEMGPNHCRITTRYDEKFFPMAFFGILHEAGHGIYELGLREDQYGLPPGTYCSLGIHESQSRMWENMVGRSRAFWEHFFAPLQSAFPSLADVSLDDFYFAVNRVGPSLIRVEADELTYNLHIIIRFELEQSLMNGDVQVADLPTAWNDKYQEYLGITPPNNAEGVLQDIHWSSTAIGYFPTYSLGNLYAAQLFAAAEEELGDQQAAFRNGEFSPLRTWLEQNVHYSGQCYSAAELVQRVTGKPLSHKPLMDYLRAKLETLYL